LTTDFATKGNENQEKNTVFTGQHNDFNCGVQSYVLISAFIPYLHWGWVLLFIEPHKALKHKFSPNGKTKLSTVETAWQQNGKRLL